MICFLEKSLLSGELLSDGNSDFVERGFLISENLRFDFPERQVFFDTFSNANLFELDCITSSQANPTTIELTP